MGAIESISNAARTERPRSRRELAEAIFAECDPVQIGIELLRSGNEKSSSVKARVWETLIGFRFGEQDDDGGERRSRGPEIEFRY